MCYNIITVYIKEFFMTFTELLILSVFVSLSLSYFILLVKSIVSSLP